MRIMMLVHNRVGRGTFLRAQSLARPLVARGHQVTIFAGAEEVSARRRETVADGVRICQAFDPLPTRLREGGLSPFDAVSRIRLLLREEFDLLHCFDHRPAVSGPGLLAAQVRSKPCLFDWADRWGFGGIADERGPMLRMTLGAMDNWLERLARRPADALTVINTSLQELASKHFTVPVHLLPVGANSDLIRPRPKAEMRRHFGLPMEASIAVHAGVAPYDADYLAESFVELSKLHPGSLLLTTGRIFPALTARAANAGISERVIQFGRVNQSDLEGLFACGDVLLLPYTNRPVNRYRYPHKLGDYLSAGRPIVTNNTGDLGQLVASERVGLVAEDTPQSFAAAIKRLFDDVQLSEDLGVRGRTLAETRLDWRFLARELEEFYRETISRYQSAARG